MINFFRLFYIGAAKYSVFSFHLCWLLKIKNLSFVNQCKFSKTDNNDVEIKMGNATKATKNYKDQYQPAL